MFKHTKCGGSHETVAQARICEQRGGVATKERPQPTKHTAAQSAILTSLRGHGERAMVRRGYGLATSTTENQRRISINAPRTGYVAMATPRAEQFARDLMAKKAWQGVSSQQAEETMRKLMAGEFVGRDECSDLITELKSFDYVQQAAAVAPVSPAPQGRQRSNSGRIKDLKAQVPDGRYAVDLPDGDKLKFFSIRTRQGYIKIKHCVSDSRYPWPFNRYEEVLEAIIAATPKVAGQRYAEEYGQCYNCGRALTDTDNPYKAVGLGPDCGPRVHGGL